MSKQIYIDSNGNEIQVSGTVNTADMMPMSGNDSTKVSEAIGDLSQLTTTDKSSLVGAVNSLRSELITQKSVSQSNVNVGANTITSIQLAVSDAKYRMVTGVYISGDACVPMQFYFSTATEIYFRVRNLANTATSCNVTIFYI